MGDLIRIGILISNRDFHFCPIGIVIQKIGPDRDSGGIAHSTDILFLNYLFFEFQMRVWRRSIERSCTRLRYDGLCEEVRTQTHARQGE